MQGCFTCPKHSMEDPTSMNDRRLRHRLVEAGNLAERLERTEGEVRAGSEGQAAGVRGPSPAGTGKGRLPGDGSPSRHRAVPGSKRTYATTSEPSWSRGKTARPPAPAAGPTRTSGSWWAATRRCTRAAQGRSPKGSRGGSVLVGATWWRSVSSRGTRPRTERGLPRGSCAGGSRPLPRRRPRAPTTS